MRTSSAARRALEDTPFRETETAFREAITIASGGGEVEIVREGAVEVGGLSTQEMLGIIATIGDARARAATLITVPATSSPRMGKSTSAAEDYPPTDPTAEAKRLAMVSVRPAPQERAGLSGPGVADAMGPFKSMVREAVQQALNAGIAIGAASREFPVDSLARALAPKIRSALRPSSVPHDDAFVDQDSGLYDREVYLRLARRRAFPSNKEGKKVVARWGDVKAAFIGAGKMATVVEPTEDPEADLLNEIRQRAGLQVRGGR